MKALLFFATAAVVGAVVAVALVFAEAEAERLMQLDMGDWQACPDEVEPDEDAVFFGWMSLPPTRVVATDPAWAACKTRAEEVEK